tara:strand:+ start:359 stop:964 length:606 start_codon:yes stop_codon:yes gene_type:complete
MAKGKAQERRLKRLSNLGNIANQNLFNLAQQGANQYMSTIQPEFQQLQGLADVFRSEMNTPFSQTTQGQGFLNAIEQQSQQARENLQDQASLLGLSDESILAGQQNISKSEGDRMQSLMQLGEQSRVNARRGFGNVINNLIGQRSAGLNLGLAQAQGSLGLARGIQQQAGQMAQGILGSLVSGASSAASAGLFDKKPGQGG